MGGKAFYLHLLTLPSGSPAVDTDKGRLTREEQGVYEHVCHTRTREKAVMTSLGGTPRAWAYTASPQGTTRLQRSDKYAKAVLGSSRCMT